MATVKEWYQWVLDRLSESSTWQGVGFIVALLGSHFGQGVDWGQGAAFGGLVSAFIKMVTKG